MITWSATRIDNATECMYKIFLQYIDGNTPRETIPLASGKYLHSVCAKFNDRDTKRINYKSADTFARQKVGVWSRLVVPSTNLEETVENEHGKTIGILKKCFKEFYNIYGDREKPADVERRFKLQFGKFIISGALDIIDKPFNYIDLKSGWTKPTENELKNDYQFTLYSAVLPYIVASDEKLESRLQLKSTQKRALKKNPIDLMEEVTGEYLHLRSGESIKVRKNKANLIELLNTVESLYHRIQQGDFSHYRGYHCKRCLLNEKCYEDRDRGRMLDTSDFTDSDILPFLQDENLVIHKELPDNIKLIEKTGRSKPRKKTKDKNQQVMFK